MVELVAEMLELQGGYREIFGRLRESSSCAESLEAPLG
jgi:hypothetical protein